MAATGNGRWEVRSGARGITLEMHGGPLSMTFEPLGAPSEDYPYSYLIASPGFMFVARRRGKKITISVPTITKTSDQPT